MSTSFSHFFAIVAQTLADVRLEADRASKNELPRQWFIAMFEKPDKFILHALITDAVPQEGSELY